jgi:hypothetical protein
MKAAVYAVNAGGGFGNKRAGYIAKAMAEGLRRCGVETVMLNHFDGQVHADIAIAYGWVHQPVFEAYLRAGAHFAYWDLGYWGRRPKGSPIDGYHRLAVDDWDTARTMLRGCSHDRFARLELEVAEPRAPGETVLIAGMSEKAGGTHGYALNQWENRTRAEIEALGTGHPVVMRPKPNSKNPPTSTIESDLAGARILVTHHSNAAVDALVAGVPCYAVKGVGTLASPAQLDAMAIEAPHFPDPEERFQLLADIAYAQWAPPEMRTGDAWQHIRDIVGG